MKHYHATYETSHMPHRHGIIETWNAFMPSCLMVMHDDEHD